jgi:hypothetical protein
MTRPTTYEEFWPYYVSQHMHPTCRLLHFVGDAASLAAAVAGFLVSPLWFLAAPVAGYGFAWVGHFLFEHNAPAAWSFPLWSLRAGLRMQRLTWLGRMDVEFRRAATLFPAPRVSARGS